MGVLGLVTMLCLPAFVSESHTDVDIRETARLLAILVDSGRVTIGRNQDLINNPSATNKGFTPERFADQTILLFKERTGHSLADLPNANLPTIIGPEYRAILTKHEAAHVYNHYTGLP